MNLSEAAETIKRTIPTEKILSLYGYTLSRDGFMRCPFHSGDHTASLKVYDAARNGAFARRGWYCFGCHAGGSVIDFVMQHDSCSFAVAVRTIDHVLGLRLLLPERGETWKTMEKEKRFQACMDDLEALLTAQIDDRERYLKLRIDDEFKRWLDLEQIPKKDRTAAEWTRLENLKSSLEYLEYKLSTLGDLRKEMREWRNSYRMRRNHLFNRIQTPPRGTSPSTPSTPACSQSPSPGRPEATPRPGPASG